MREPSILRRVGLGDCRLACAHQLTAFCYYDARPNMALQRTRAARFARIGSPLNARPLGRARGSRSLDDPCELSSRCSGSDQGTKEQIKSDCGISSLHFRHSGLTGANELGEPSLGQISGLPSLAQTLSERKPELDEFNFLFGESQELASRANLPAGGLEFLPLCGFHRSPHVLVVVSQSPSAISNDRLWRRGSLLVEDVENQNGVPVDPVEDSPYVRSRIRSSWQRVPIAGMGRE